MSLNESIDDHATGDYTVTRRTGGEWSEEGRFTRGTVSTFSVSASVQPAGAELSDLPEGQSLSDVRMVYTATLLYARKRGVEDPDDPGQEVGAIEPDEIEIDGEAFTIWKVDKWDHWGETHWVATAVKPGP